jgi:hypothetical protein
MDTPTHEIALRCDEVHIVAKCHVPADWKVVTISGGAGWQRPDGTILAPWLMCELQTTATDGGDGEFIPLDWAETADEGVQIADYTTHGINEGG